jgi:hypothetical protein
MPTLTFQITDGTYEMLRDLAATAGNTIEAAAAEILKGHALANHARTPRGAFWKSVADGGLPGETNGDKYDRHINAALSAGLPLQITARLRHLINASISYTDIVDALAEKGVIDLDEASLFHRALKKEDHIAKAAKAVLMRDTNLGY